ncbi:uncharacterized protein LY89DRAFT_603246 [Mollisia scopiformis]|uniref:Uncharacterized protein n=1 Tax=Mollisia scopiformis TaxID=149040 RepID=A0A132B274_MOLSC|nr:uncharacterized protein LY89DRAFT_603246 [Mollisia scopiformis]KUJ06482.1 hypothetical protein LY89DRAFT_603246 [Mollisia scopiformis]
MNAHVQEPTKKDAAVANKHTGFPEPFSEDRNTTLPHPEADTSPNATIEAPDVDLTRTHSRSSFLHRKHHSHHLWNSHDTPEKMGLYDNITYADDDTETLAPEHIEKANGVDGIHEEVEQKKGLLKKLVMHKA